MMMIIQFIVIRGISVIIFITVVIIITTTTAITMAIFIVTRR